LSAYLLFPLPLEVFFEVDDVFLELGGGFGGVGGFEAEEGFWEFLFFEEESAEALEGL
jgi:hypothetical protein